MSHWSKAEMREKLKAWKALADKQGGLQIHARHHLLGSEQGDEFNVSVLGIRAPFAPEVMAVPVLDDRDSEFNVFESFSVESLLVMEWLTDLWHSRDPFGLSFRDLTLRAAVHHQCGWGWYGGVTLVSDRGWRRVGIVVMHTACGIVVFVKDLAVRGGRIDEAEIFEGSVVPVGLGSEAGMVQSEVSPHPPGTSPN